LSLGAVRAELYMAAKNWELMEAVSRGLAADRLLNAKPVLNRPAQQTPQKASNQRSATEREATRRVRSTGPELPFP
jgi:hypothetical protein